MALWLSREWPGAGHWLCWSPQLESSPQLQSSPQLELWALMVQECHSEVVAGVSDATEFDEG